MAAAAALLGAHLFSVVLASGENAAAVPAGLLLGLLVVAVATWMPMVIPATLLGGAGGSAAFAAAQATVRGSLRTRVAALFALVGVPLLLVVPVGWLRGSLAERPRRDGWGVVEFVATELALTVALLVVAAWQGAILARVYLRRVTEGEADARLEGMAGGAGRAAPAMLAAVLLPAVVVGAVTLINPSDAPVVAAEPLSEQRRIVAAGWGEHGHPVLVTLSGTVEWCLDDRCRQTRSVSTPLLISSGPTNASIGADGSVLVTRLELPRQLQVARCVSDGTCVVSELSWPGDAWPPSTARTAAEVAPDGALLIATAWDVLADDADPDDAEPTGVELVLARCGDPACADPLLVEFGTVDTRLPDPYLDLPPYGPVMRQERAEDTIRVDVDARGAPVLTLRNAATGQVWLGSCESAACQIPRLDQDPTAPPALPMPDVLAHAAAGEGLVAVVGEVAPTGMLITIGEVAGKWQPVAWLCAEPSCADRRTFPLGGDLFPGRYDVHLAVRDDRTVLAVVGYMGGYYLFTWTQ